MILRNKKVIFFHIPRTAGSSIESALFGGEAKWQEMRKQTHKKWGGKCNKKCAFGYDPENNWAAQHVTPREITSYISPADYKEYFKFTIVRNPWDRLVSTYIHNRFKKIPFKKFIELTKNVIIKGLYKPGVSKDARHVHLAPQTDYTHPESASPLDFIGKFENLNKDFKKICDKINLNVKLIHINKSNHKKYKDYYTSETAEIVASLYKKEIDYFNYRF